MSERGPITAELRAALDVDREFMRADGTVVAQTFCVDRGDFERMCDAIDAVRAALERENAELCERVAVLDKRGDYMHDGRRITDELRAWWVRKFPVMDKELHKDFTAIADRIDAEHEEAIQQVLMNEGGVPATDENMAEHGWIRLPLDADGEYIYAGDVLDGYGKTIEVVEMRYGRSGWVLISRDGNGYADTFAFSHHHAPTVEDVLYEFVDRAQALRCVEDEDMLVAEYAKRLTLVGDAE